MRFSPLALLLLWCSGLLGQPVLQPFDLTPLGYTADIIAAEFIEPTPASDQPQAWDFSGVSGSAVALLALEPSTLSPFNDAFSGAEWTNTVGDQVSFWALQEGDFTILGNANVTNGVTLPFDDPLVQWSLPMGFGDVVEDTFSADMMLFGQPYSLVGEATTEVDAWGSLVMPDGTEMEEVLRANYVQSYEEAYAGDTNTWVLNQVFYFAQDSIMPVFLHEDLVVLDADSAQILAVTDVAWYANHLLSVPEVEMEVVSLPYPNPVNRGQDVQWELPRGWSWEAVAADGRRLAEGTGDAFGRVSIPTGEWDTGIVLLVPRSPDGRAVGQPHRVFVR